MYLDNLRIRDELARVAELMQGYLEREKKLHEMLHNLTNMHASIANSMYEHSAHVAGQARQQGTGLLNSRNELEDPMHRSEAELERIMRILSEPPVPPPSANVPERADRSVGAPPVSRAPSYLPPAKSRVGDPLYQTTAQVSQMSGSAPATPPYPPATRPSTSILASNIEPSVMSTPPQVGRQPLSLPTALPLGPASGSTTPPMMAPGQPGIPPSTPLITPAPFAPRTQAGGPSSALGFMKAPSAPLGSTAARVLPAAPSLSPPAPMLVGLQKSSFPTLSG